MVNPQAASFIVGTNPQRLVEEVLQTWALALVLPFSLVDHVGIVGKINALHKLVQLPAVEPNTAALRAHVDKHLVAHGVVHGATVLWTSQ